MTYTIDESLSDSEFTAPLNVPGTFGYSRVIESITIHHWGSFGQTHDGVLDWFVNRNPNTSAHFVVSDGRIHCLVSPANAAWAAGNAYGNARSIHLECRPEATEGDYATVAWLVAWLRGVYGDLPLKGHREWTATACPGKWDLARLDALARGITPASGTTTPIEEEITVAEADRILAQVQKMHDVTRSYIVDQSQKQHDVTRGYLADRVQDASPADIVAAIPEGIAQQVLDGLAARLKGDA